MALRLSQAPVVGTRRDRPAGGEGLRPEVLGPAPERRSVGFEEEREPMWCPSPQLAMISGVAIPLVERGVARSAALMDG